MESSTNLRFAIFILVFVLGGIILVSVGHLPTAGSSTTIKDVTLSESDLQSNDQAEVLTAKANSILARMKAICAEQGSQFIGPDTFLPTSGRILQMEWEDDVGPKMQLTSKDYTFSFWMETNQLAMFINEDLEDRLYGKNAPQLDRPDTPRLTGLQAKQSARGFLPLVEIPDGIKLAAPHPQFEPQTNLPTYRYGWWSTAWARIDDEGHIYGCDHGVSVDIPEGYGPVSMGAGLRVQYTKADGPPLSLESALALSQQAIADSRSGIAPGLIPNDVGIVDDKFFESSLAIVEAMPKVPRWKWWVRPRSATRLAWVLWFEPVFAVPVVGPTYDHRFEVTIDAHTGEVLGTDGML